MIEGAVTAAGHELAMRDAIGITGRESVSVTAGAASRLLCLDVPMR